MNYVVKTLIKRYTESMRIGYGRVSTRDQNPDAQEDALKAAGCDRIFVDRASGKLASRPELDKALIAAREGRLDLQMEAHIEDVVRTRLGGAFAPSPVGARDFLQLRASYRVRGRIGDEMVDFTALGAAETFRGASP